MVPPAGHEGLKPDVPCQAASLSCSLPGADTGQGLWALVLLASEELCQSQAQQRHAVNVSGHCDQAGGKAGMLRDSRSRQWGLPPSHRKPLPSYHTPVLECTPAPGPFHLGQCGAINSFTHSLTYYFSKQHSKYILVQMKLGSGDQ